MNKERLSILLTDPTLATEEDRQQLQALLEQYPYAQVLHILLAKISFLLHTPEKQTDLNTAALYSSMRSSLKKVIEEDNFPGKQPHIFPFQDLPVFEKLENLKISTVFEEDESESSTIFKEVMLNLEKLKALREQFQFLELNPVETHPEPANVETPPKEKVEKTTKPPKSAKPEVVTHKPTQPPISELEENLDIQVNAFFLSAIAKKDQPSPEDAPPKTALQMNLIDKFIKEQPTMGTMRKEMEKNAGEGLRDLSERSTRFGDNLISENLAIILLRQGKKDRAVEIYKKLIWKLPQKKAYFAARIEEIKK